MKQLIGISAAITAAITTGCSALPAIDQWNRPTDIAASREVAMDRCLAQLKVAVPKAIRDWDFLRDDEWTKVEIRESYCESVRNSKFKDLGFVKGILVYLTTDKQTVLGSGAGSTEVNQVYVVHGDSFPWTQ